VIPRIFTNDKVITVFSAYSNTAGISDPRPRDLSKKKKAIFLTEIVCECPNVFIAARSEIIEKFTVVLIPVYCVDNVSELLEML